MTTRRILAALLCATALCCAAEDTVRIKYHPGYPMPGRSTEVTELVVTRSFEWRGSSAEVDRYFSNVRDLLAELEKSENCGGIAIHSPTVNVKIELNGHAFSRACTFRNGSVQANLNASPEQLRHNQAFDRLSKLTVEYAGSTFQR